MTTPYDDLRSLILDLDEVEEMIEIAVCEKKD